MGRTSNKREEILRFLTQFVAENGYAPSVREICAAVGLQSTATVHYHLGALREAGLIEMDDMKKRAITLPDAHRADRIPVVGVVTAGVPILAVENIEGYIPWEGEAGCFALRVRGDSMIGARIMDGDIVFIRAQDDVDDGEIAAVVLNDEATLYYAQETVTKGWNRDLLLNAIKLNMYETQALARVDNNFDRTLPAEQAQYANEVFSSSYNLGFLGVTSPILELELEDRLVKAITRFLMELGNGFTFIGNQHVLEYNGKESKVDMLFFHRGLRCLVAVDLKIGAFKPEYAGKMNYYLSLLDRLERGADENRSIGIILCAEKDRVEVELALEDMGKPIGVADYQLIVPKEKLQKVLADEIKAFGEEKVNNKE